GGRIWVQTGVIFSMYVLGILTALAVATLFKRTLMRGPTPAFIMELPPYHIPRPGPVLRTMWDRSRLFLTRAGTTIVPECIVLWALAYFPRNIEAERWARQQRASLSGASSAVSAKALRAIEDERAARQLRESYLGRLGHAFEPVVRPLGSDWKIGVGILASFAA